MGLKDADCAGRGSEHGPENKRLALRYDRLASIIHPLLQAACIFLVAHSLTREL
ncbi:MAG TPA: hypothetical protein VGN83_18730 [Falsiroseomonas sp.]|jgi:hypothetical protein|nr:hypothetical protein [Falsiroseomonas sp.]